MISDQVAAFFIGIATAIIMPRVAPRFFNPLLRIMPVVVLCFVAGSFFVDVDLTTPIFCLMTGIALVTASVQFLALEVIRKITKERLT